MIRPRPHLTLLLLLWFPSRPAAAVEPVELSLETIVERVRQSNPLVDGALAELAELDGKAVKARLAWAGRGSWVNDFSAFPTCSGELYDTDSSECEDPTAAAYDFGQLRPHFRGRLFYGLPLFSFGKIGAGKDAAAAGVQAGRRQVELARAQAVLLATRAYWSALLYDRLDAVARVGLGHLEAAQKKLQERIDQDDDEVDERDPLRLAVWRSEVVAHVQAARRGKAMSIAGLRLAVGLEPHQPLRLSGKLEALESPRQSLEEAITRALDRNPEIQAARAAVTAREALVAFERAQFWPDLVVGVGLSYRSTPGADCLPDLQNFSNQCQGANFVSPPIGALRLEWRLDVPARLSALRQAEARAAKARADERALSYRLRLDVEQSWRKLQEAKQMLSIRDTAAQAARKWVVGAVMDRQLGVGSPRELLEALAAQAKTTAARHQTIYDQNVSSAELESLLGPSEQKLSAPTTSKGQQGGGK